jgi:DNA-binding response OmpR family regulator
MVENSRIVTDRTVDTHVKNMRQKKLLYSLEVELILSIYGAGCKLELY